MTDRPTRTNARTGDEILEAVARREWWEDHSQECPPYMVPTCADLADAGLIVMVHGIGSTPVGGMSGEPGPWQAEPSPAPAGVETYIQTAHASWAPPAEHPLTEKVRTWWGLPKRVDRNTQATRIMPSTTAIAPRNHPRGHLFMPHGAGRAGEGMPLFPGPR